MAQSNKTKKPVKPVSQLREEIHAEINAKKVSVDITVHAKTAKERKELKLAKKLWKKKANA